MGAADVGAVIMFTIGVALIAMSLVGLYCASKMGGSRYRGGEVPHIKNASTAVRLHPARDEFVVYCVCPRCATGDVHNLRESNPDPPRLVRASDGETEQIVNWSGERIRQVFIQPDLYDRWDERPYDVVRTCNSCGYEWGQS